MSTDVGTLKEFETAARAFLAANATPKSEVNLDGADLLRAVTVFPENSAEEDIAELEVARAWLRQVFDAGFGWITGPTEFGGRGLTSAHERAYRSVASEFVTPRLTTFGISLGMVAPTVLAHGTETAKQEYLRGLWRGDINGCQLFSEPGAGSDVAALATQAVRDGDEWVINGQKVWTSMAHLADIGMVLTRTNTDVAKHRGLTMFLIDMRSPGVEVRPLRQMSGGASFNEVFLTDVRVADAYRLGDVDNGWQVTLTTLMNERMAGGEMNRMGASDRLQHLARHVGVADDPLIRQQLVEVYINHQVAKMTNARASSKLQAGQLPGPEMSIGKLAATRNMQRISATVSSILGPHLVAETDPDLFTWATYLLAAPGMRLGGGTDEIQCNIIGERVLGLPREPSPATS